LQFEGASAGAVAPAALDAKGELGNGAMQLDLHLASGSAIAMEMTGLVPLSAAGAVELRAKGRLDLTILDPVLTAGGRRIQGELTLDAAMEGSFAAPRITGTARLAKGEMQDFTNGLRLTGMTAEVAADGATVRLVDLRAAAGPGTLTASGTVAPLADGIPVALTITARNAKPLASDLLTAALDADLTLRGKAAEHLDLAGQIRVQRADINIPDSFPPGVAVLNVKQRGVKPPPPAPPGLALGLDLTIDAPQQVFVRGHGLDAEMGGTLRLGGTLAAPQIAGGFDLRRGTFSLASETLNFTSGRVSFDGSRIGRQLDPTLHFVAESSAASVTATLTVTGYADAPQIAISSVPELPQDEALAQLLFGQSVKQLSPFQLAEIAQAVAALSGVGGGLDPLAAVRKGLGLDRLSAGTGSSGSGASLQAGKYIANGVYVGAQQGSTSGSTRAQVQIDLTKHLKLDTNVGSGGAAPATGITPDNDPGSSIGFTYQLEY
jgi:translocation and assembly module TamB